MAKNLSKSFEKVYIKKRHFVYKYKVFRKELSYWKWHQRLPKVKEIVDCSTVSKYEINLLWVNNKKINSF